VDGLEVVDFPKQFDGVDAVMAMGGDGTMLRVVRALGGRDIPVIGVNIGSLGFMTSVAEQDLDRALDCLAADNFEMSHRAVLHGQVVQAGQVSADYQALNDIVISGGASSRVVTLEVGVDGNHVTSYVCDGLIISTPTGSTGHNLSAGGPIVVPETAALVMSLICPHALSSRPLVLPQDSEIVVRGTSGTEHGLQLSADGQVGQTLAEDEAVHVKASKAAVRFIHLPGYNYFSVLSQKLGWKGSSVR
ncbi:MAG: NAD(+)/NADH kinase, partial [Verrucomicrobia bacterium]|nr:NAD(+)/NADH kinase [Verrucomicrobiota bacterium]